MNGKQYPATVASSGAAAAGEGARPVRSMPSSEIWAAEPVFDPETDPEERAWLIEHRDLLWTAGEPGAVQSSGLPDTPAKDLDDHVKAMGLVALPMLGLIVFGLLLEMEASRSMWALSLLCQAVADVSFFGAAILSACTTVLAVALVRVRRAGLSQKYALAQVARMRECYILPELDLDDECKALLLRARTAGLVIAGARAHAEGFGLTGEYHRVLSPQIWHLAVELAALTDQAAVWAAEGAEVTREVHTARILTLAGERAALEERVAAIEAHADRIAELDLGSQEAPVAERPAVEEPALAQPAIEQPAFEQSGARVPDGFTAAETTWLLPVIAPEPELRGT